MDDYGRRRWSKPPIGQFGTRRQKGNRFERTRPPFSSRGHPWQRAAARDSRPSLTSRRSTFRSRRLRRRSCNKLIENETKWPTIGRPRDIKNWHPRVVAPSLNHTAELLKRRRLPFIAKMGSPITITPVLSSGQVSSNISFNSWIDQSFMLFNPTLSPLSFHSIWQILLKPT